MQTIGWIGMGNMGRAIAEGFVRGGVDPDKLWGYAPHYDRLRAFADSLGMHACRAPEEALARADAVVLAVKPQIVEDVLGRLRENLKGKALLSVVAGYPYRRLRTLTDESVRIQFVMPNLPCVVGEGALLMEEENSLTPEERTRVEELLGSMGKVVSLPSRLMDAGMAVSGCGPAFVAIFQEAMADAGVRLGLPRETAYALAGQTLVGAARLQMATGDLPAKIKDGVCSPGGVTIRGVDALERGGFRGVVMAAVESCVKD